MKILITSDNHLGYKETDPILSLDSFNAFEEILKSSDDCDLMIVAGDLFHSNKPSRFTMYKTITLFRQYVLGDKEILFTSNKALNYMKPDINISLPIVAINGNHDDPCGFGSLSALDILHETGLVNYVGKICDFERIIVEPLILKQEKVVALYFLSHVRDSRLFRLFSQNKVEFLKAEADLYILVVHQNRIERTQKDFLPSEFIPSFFNLIIFGHEHDPLLFEKSDQTYLQCGSTVRTSLSDSETGKKYFYKLDVGNNVKIEKIELLSVRTFLFDTISACNKESIESKIDEMLATVKKCDNCEEMFFCARCKPLVRLRIEESIEFDRFLLQNTYANYVANPNDVFSFIKKRKVAVVKNKKNVQTASSDIYSILNANLQAANLKIIPEIPFVEKFKEFVEKENKNAFANLVDELEKYRKMPIIGCEEDHFVNIKKNISKKYVRENNMKIKSSLIADSSQENIWEKSGQNSSLIYDIEDFKTKIAEKEDFIAAGNIYKKTKIDATHPNIADGNKANFYDIEYKKDFEVIKNEFKKKALNQENNERKTEENTSSKNKFTFSDLL